MTKNHFLRAIALFFGISAFAAILTACVIVINQPSAEEKELLAIQDTVGQEVSSISQKVSSGGTSGAEIEDYIAQAENTISQALQRINELQIPEKTKQFAQDTIKYLENAKKVFQQIRDLLTNIDELKSKSSEMTAQASAAIEEQIQNMRKNVEVFSGQLNGIAKQIQTARQEIMDLYAKAK